MKRFAILYDFDYTLSKGFMHEYGLMQFFGHDNIYNFYDEINNCPNSEDMDQCLSLLYGILRKAKEKKLPVTKEFLMEFGKDIKFYPGVKDYFKKINKVGKDNGFEVEHFIISSGSKEIVEGSPIAKNFKRIYASNYCYDKKGIAYWPCQIVNYSTKIQFVYRVRKNVLDNLSSYDEVNQKKSKEEVLPFDHIIYIGDSQTDIPSFTVVKKYGGLSICVYDNDHRGSINVAKECYEQGRVNAYALADYREGGELFNLIKNYIESKSN